MNKRDFFKLMLEAYQNAEKEAAGKVFIVKPSVMSRLTAVRSAATRSRIEYSERFDPALNAIDIELSSYVFDSVAQDMHALLITPDLFVIDALNDGKIRIQARILDACEELANNTHN